MCVPCIGHSSCSARDSSASNTIPGTPPRTCPRTSMSGPRGRRRRHPRVVYPASLAVRPREALAIVVSVLLGGFVGVEEASARLTALMRPRRPGVDVTHVRGSALEEPVGAIGPAASHKRIALQPGIHTCLLTRCIGHPGEPLTANAGVVGAGWVVVGVRPASDAFAGPALDPGELLHIDVDELARPGVLVPDSWLEPDPAEPPDPARAQHRQTVERGINSVSAISAAVIRAGGAQRSRRRDQARCGCRPDAERTTDRPNPLRPRPGSGQPTHVHNAR